MSDENEIYEGYLTIDASTYSKCENSYEISLAFVICSSLYRRYSIWEIDTHILARLSKMSTSQVERVIKKFDKNCVFDIRKISKGVYSFQNFSEDEEYLKNLDYKKYLKTKHWRKMRNAAFKIADYKCQLCYSDGAFIKGGLHVHHRTYERLGKERQSDLTVLCKKCHEKFHDK